MKAFKKWAHYLWKEWLRPVLPIVLIIVPLRSSIADYNPVPTGSMNPTILEGDLVYVNKIAYDLRVPLTKWRIHRWANPETGDMVVLFSPDDHTRLVKRVIGTPGDIIEMKNNRLRINGKAVRYTKIDGQYLGNLHENQKNAVLATEHLGDSPHAVMALPQITAIRSFGPIRVPEGQYFMMGDNRDNSLDSRYFGFVERDEIIGRVEAVIGSLDIKNKYHPRFDRFFKDVD